MDTKTNVETDTETDTETGEEKSARDRILTEIKCNPVITQKQLAEKVGLSYSGIRYTMRQLQDEGILKRTGSTKKGRWIIDEL
ncbi:winged helix-turn-helix transcriptional regulator [Erysipelotrichaceae bacterium 66202529]|nr:winged helix-turn-helix transcriptional regulator [Erysipelotrichaceae bacterium 66202529]